MRNQSEVHLHSHIPWLGRAVRKCTTCRVRRRFVVRIHEWYAPYWTCGGCGYAFAHGRFGESTSIRNKNRAWVKEMWPKVPSLSDATKEMTEAGERLS